MGCDHKLKHLDTKRSYRHVSNNSVYEYKRVDNFYCGKCGEIISKTKTEIGYKEPDWY